jgi:DNA-binding NarL/FixJ family response regulator
VPGEEATIKVLIADDDPIVRAVREGLVARADDLVLVGTLVLVGAAGSASEAASLAEEHQPHVAVLDWVMPDGGGPRAADDISSVSPETKIIALTASDSEHAAMGMLRAGAINVLVKDSSMSTIADAIRSASRD